MKHTHSLKKNSAFRQVYKKGKAIANRQLVMILLPNRQSFNRLGITVSKKVGKSVKRSRVTRLIRESYRLNEDRLAKGLDIVVIARVGTADLTFQEMAASFLHLARKHGLLIGGNAGV